MLLEAPSRSPLRVSIESHTKAPLSSSTMLTLFGGSISDLTPMLTDERFAEDWEPRVRSRFGLTMAKFNTTVIPVELGVNTKRIIAMEADKKKNNGDSATAQPTD
jgi:hypothetical protein